jgi:hypothetical protein
MRRVPVAWSFLSIRGFERMWRWLQTRFDAFPLAWADAQALIDRYGDMSQREAILRVQDPYGGDGLRSSRYWRRVARIIAWRTGQATISDVQAKFDRAFGGSRPVARSARSARAPGRLGGGERCYPKGHARRDGFCHRLLQTAHKPSIYHPCGWCNGTWKWRSRRTARS